MLASQEMFLTQDKIRDAFLHSQGNPCLCRADLNLVLEVNPV